MMPNLSLKVWGILGGALLAGLLLAALFATRATLADEKRERVLAETKLTVSNSSIGTLQGEIRRMVNEQKSLEAGDAARVQASREALHIAHQASEYRQAVIARLRTSAEDLRPENDCVVSEAVKEVWP